MPFARNELPGSFILELIDVPRRQFSYVDPPSGRWVTLDLTGVPYLTLWSDGGPFLCIEPCWGLTDHHEQRKSTSACYAFDVTSNFPRAIN